jgi:hypothetical protein
MANTNAQLVVKKFFTVEELNMLLLLVDAMVIPSLSNQFEVRKQLQLKLHFLSKNCGPQQQ